MPRESRHIRFYDTTLRDGEQTPGVAFSRERRLRIARALDEMGVDEIELGFAASGAEQMEDMRAVVRAGVRAATLSLARPVAADVDAACAAGVDGVILFVGASEIHLRHKLQKTLAEVTDLVAGAAAYARRRGLFVQVSLEDATRTAPAVLQSLARATVQAGAQRVGLADTVGVATPRSMKALVRAVRAAVPVPVAVHCHDDFGMAVANSLAAVEAGAAVLSTTIGGMGERSGNASTETCAAALAFLHGHRVSLDLTRTQEVAALVAECSGLPIPAHRPITGRNCFRHESGIHVAAVLRSPSCYEPIDPALVGARRTLELGKTSGRAAVRHFAGQLGVRLDDDQCARVLQQLKELAEAGGRDLATELPHLIDACHPAPA